LISRTRKQFISLTITGVANELMDIIDNEIFTATWHGPQTKTSRCFKQLAPILSGGLPGNVNFDA
jgi:hypothetical protein